MMHAKYTLKVPIQGNELIVFKENAQINLQSNNSNFCISFPGSNPLFPDKHLMM